MEVNKIKLKSLNIYIVRYEGEFVQGLKHGKGKLFFPNGSIYEGEFKANYQDGYGVYYFAKGKVYTGNWY